MGTEMETGGDQGMILGAEMVVGTGVGMGMRWGMGLKELEDLGLGLGLGKGMVGEMG